MLSNFHTHTFRCQHASGEDKEYVEAAIQSGLKVLGFSDHCPWLFPDGYISRIRMTPAQLDNYFSSTPLYNFFVKKNNVQDTLVYNEFAKIHYKGK
jgi:histidinol-phosphatase (PHP family)